MKMPPFEYACPTTLSEAVALLASRDGDAKALAGGQSLLPMLAFRLAPPALLVDLRKLAELARASRSRRSGVTLGAMVRWRDILDDARLVERASAAPGRDRGTSRITRSAIAARSAAASRMPIRPPRCPASRSRARRKSPWSDDPARASIKAAEFFQRPADDRARADEIIVEMRLPAWPAGRRWGFQEFARRRGDFALAGAALFYDQDESGQAHATPMSASSASRDRPLRLHAVEAVLNGQAIDDGNDREGGSGSQRPPSIRQDDIHASAAYRRSLVGTMVERALRDARSR